MNGDPQKLNVPVPPEPVAAGKPASHDTAAPNALIDFMLSNWKPGSGKAPPKVKDHAAFAARRRALSKAFSGETLVIPTGHEQVRANDTNYRFRPGSDFYYLTGNLEPDSVLVLQPKEGGGHTDILFVEPNPGRGDATFYTDRVKGELWVGPRLGVEESRIRYAIDEARGLPELPSYLKGLKTPATRPWRVLRDFSPKVDGALPKQAERDRELGHVLSEMRLIKDKVELRELQAAVDATYRGFEDVIRSLAEAATERVVEGVFGLRARVEGNDVGYGSICASGAHACILHWTQNDGALSAKDLILLDAGVEGNSLYTADVTRTLPISGKFSPAQREVYELVLEAQKAAFEEVKPGNDFMAPNNAAMRVLAHGLERMGILDSAEEALEPGNQFYKRYTLHNVSHMLGIDVHDCAKARAEAYRHGALKPGMVLTVEPGLYFQKDDLTVPAKYRGIGVRIEDDVVVVKGGMRNLSGAFPSEVKDVERWIAGLWRSRKKATLPSPADAKLKPEALGAVRSTGTAAVRKGAAAKTAKRPAVKAAKKVTGKPAVKAKKAARTAKAGARIVAAAGKASARAKATKNKK